MTPDAPENELSRLNALHALNILDTSSEERFDRITRMAKRLFDVPIALVSLVDANRQWFKSCVGLEATETPRDISFCGHAILGDELFIIPNALEDARFADNPLVTEEPHIRFYAGCPLKASDGSKIGTLCIIDHEPRAFEGDDCDALADLAAMVEQEMHAVQIATMDELTNLSNRRGFLLLAEHSLNFCRREKLPASLFYIDLDNFKPINDRFGHVEGDRALVAFAKRLHEAFRDSDVVARLGGDEFAVLLANASTQSARDSVARFSESVDAFNMSCEHDYVIEFSCGMVAFNPEKHQTIDALLADGDRAMYQAKHDNKKLKTG